MDAVTFVNNHMTNLCNAAYKSIADLGTKVYICVREEAVLGTALESAVINEHITLDVSIKACPDLRIENGFLYTSMTYRGKHVDLCIPLPAIVGFRDPSGEFVIETNTWRVFINEQAAVKKAPQVKDKKSIESSNDAGGNVVSLFRNKK